MSTTRSSGEVSGRHYLRGQIARELTAAIGQGNVSQDPADLQAGASDWSWYSKYLTYKSLEQPAADIAVRPANTAEVERIVQIASDYRIPIVTRGGGSGTQGGTFAPYGGISLDLARLTDIVEIDEQSLIVTTGTGIDGPTLEKSLNEKGLTLAHYPG
ncbi:MAG: FAD-binding protein, partial [Salinibacterium sp.]|nr:FAD-binding protein [Salinibacterium sp.]